MKPANIGKFAAAGKNSLVCKLVATTEEMLNEKDLAFVSLETVPFRTTGIKGKLLRNDKAHFNMEIYPLWHAVMT